MKNYNRKFSGIIFILAGIIHLAYLLNIIIISLNEFYMYLFLFWGLIFTTGNLGKGLPGIIFLGTISFLVGSILLVNNYYEILNSFKISNFSLFFMLGSGFLMLFIDNFSENRFLWISLICFGVFGISAVKYDEWSILAMTSRFDYILYNYWPVFLILSGLGALAE